MFELLCSCFAILLVLFMGAVPLVISHFVWNWIERTERNERDIHRRNP